LKSMLSTGHKIPQKGILLSTGTNKNKAELLDELNVLKNMGLKFYGTKGTADFYTDNGLEVEVLFRPYDNEEPSILSYLASGKIDLVINIPKSAEKVELDSDYIIRRKAIDMNIPLITNIQFAKRFIKALKRYKTSDLLIKSWDEYN
jgi:carbamoyl-phosphate synthase large subunit